MSQYLELKGKYPDCLLFFRLGDFYELFGDDAVAGSRILNLTLTKRHETPMCGIPYHALDNYLGRLTKAGRKVALCEQLSDPALPGIVKRDVVRVITPGTTLDERILSDKSHNFIVSIVRNGEVFGLAAVDLSTGLFLAAQPTGEQALNAELQRLEPAECIVDQAAKQLPESLRQFDRLPVFPHQFWEEPEAFLSRFFAVKDMRGFGISDEEQALGAAALLLSYLKETQKCELKHIRPPKLIAHRDEMLLDDVAIRNLELVASLRECAREGSLLAVMDKTETSMGARLLKHWLLNPSTKRALIERRLDAVEEVKKNYELKNGLGELLATVLDIERLLARVSLGTGNARDLLGIAHSLSALELLQNGLGGAQSELLRELSSRAAALTSLKELAQLISTALVPDPPISIREGGLIAAGHSAELDELRAISHDGKSMIQKMQEEETTTTGISSLKIRYNQVFGYFIEVTKSNLDKVPERYIRKQTMTNAERFITPELKEFEEKILGAEGKSKDLEYQLFLELREQVKEETTQLQEAAELFAVSDVLLSLSRLAESNGYTRPVIGEFGEALSIKGGRHPVVESISASSFVPNDTELGGERTAAVITGPNMGGKSTYLRQTALIALMAHIGSFVPAESAHIPLIDRIFTRVGASDNLAHGQSTFMVEMQETAHILHYATDKSLIILDEVGRGTSTYDGVSLAWSILEFIHNELGAKLLFATHYHELISVADRLAHASNMSVAVKEADGRIAFLYRVLPGAIDRSYGIEVARLAGLPASVIAKAQATLSELEEEVVEPAVVRRVAATVVDPQQESLFTPVRDERQHRVLKRLEEVEVEKITPLEALQKLDELKKMR